MARPSKYQTHVEPYFGEIKEALEKGVDDKEIAKNLGVSISSWCEYKHKFPAFSELFKNTDRSELIKNLESALIMYKIANKFNCTIADLVKWNKITNPNLIYVGQKLIVGWSDTPVPPEPVKVYYTVQRGDNLTKIANKFGTTVNQLVAWNNIKNPNIIYVGQVLRVK